MNLSIELLIIAIEKIHTRGILSAITWHGYVRQYRYSSMLQMST